MSEAFRKGAFHGVVVWGAYAAGEIAAATLRPLLMNYRDVTPPELWEFTIWLLAIYGLAGGVLGGLASLAYARWWGGAGAAHFPIAVLTLVLAYLANILSAFDPANAAHLVVLLVGLAMLAVGLLNLWSADRWPALAPLSTPWVSVAILLGIPLLTHDLRLRNLVAGLAAVALIWLMTPKLLGVAGPKAQWRQAVSVALAIPAVLAATAAAGKPAPSLEAIPIREAAQSGPNVLLIVLDAVRADHLSVYGYGRPTTPRLEEFAREATLYARATATSNFTLPTHASIFTGKYPRNHGAIPFPPGKSGGLSLARRHQTMAEILAERGYLTLAVVANGAFVTRESGLAQGFQMFDGRLPVECVPDRGDHYLRRSVRRLLTPLMWTGRFDLRARRAREITNEAVELIEEAARRGRPLFLFLNYFDAHMPYVPPPPYDTMFPGRTYHLTRDRYFEIEQRVFGRGEPIDPGERDHLISQYDGSLAYLDAEVGRLIEHLKRTGIYDNTLLIVTSDHGEAFGEHFLLGHLQSLRQHQLWIPLLIRYPGQRAGKRVEPRVSQVDLLPTVLEALGIDAPGDCDGQSLLRSPSADHRLIFAEAYVDAGNKGIRPDYPDRELAVLSNNLKLFTRSNGEIHFYDLAADPAEEHNLYHPADPRAAELLAELNRWLERNPLRVELQAPPDPKTLDRLRALGYIR
jgi:arylsulfatase A-like enzyme